MYVNPDLARYFQYYMLVAGNSAFNVVAHVHSNNLSPQIMGKIFAYLSMKPPPSGSLPRGLTYPDSPSGGAPRGKDMPFPKLRVISRENPFINQ